jgi:cyclase
MPPEDQIPDWDTGMIQLAPGVHAYQQPGGWCRSNGGLIVGEEFAVVVDTQFTADLNAAYVTAVRQATDVPVRYVINTHHHGDHCFGNHHFEGAVSVAHRLCREEMIRRGQPRPDWLGQKFPRYDFRGVRYVLPEITFGDRQELYQGERTIELIYCGPCHSVADIAVYLPQESTVFCGDLLFLYNAPLGLESSFERWISVLDELVALGARYYVPGHGPVCDADGLRDLKGYLSLIRGETETRYRAGVPPLEAALDIDLGRYRSWHCWERIIANVHRLYCEFAGEAPDSAINTDGLMAEMDRVASRR